MDQGIKLCVGKGAAEHLEAFFAAAHPGQPVVHERHPQPGQWRRDTNLVIETQASGDPRRAIPATELAVSVVTAGPEPRMRASMPASSPKSDQFFRMGWKATQIRRTGQGDNLPQKMCAIFETF